jgi:hypothetical protein
MSVTMQFKGRCVGGSTDLSRYPNLAHTESKGVFTHLAGVSIEDVVSEADAISYGDGSASLIAVMDTAADNLGVTLDELLDAVRYARANKLI